MSDEIVTMDDEALATMAREYVEGGQSLLGPADIQLLLGEMNKRIKLGRLYFIPLLNRVWPMYCAMEASRNGGLEQAEALPSIVSLKAMVRGFVTEAQE